MYVVPARWSSCLMYDTSLSALNMTSRASMWFPLNWAHEQPTFMSEPPVQNFLRQVISPPKSMCLMETSLYMLMS
ncbi:hypothetical protein AYI70_g11227, partial [Smittium culicis]